jgi:DNA-binding MarR family transcriptional regulator
LTVIERNPGLTQSQVAAALGIKRTNFVGLLDELERRVLAGRRQAARDKRSYALYLTGEGAALMRKLKVPLKAHESRMIARVGEEGRGRLVALLHEIAAGPNGTRVKRSASRSPRPGSVAT